MIKIRTTLVSVCVAGAALACAPDSKTPHSLSQVAFEVTRVIELDSAGTDARDVLLRDDELWVVTDHAPFISIFGRDGKVLHRFGDAGRGPRDLLSPWALLGAARDSVPWIYDAGKKAVLQLPVRSLQVKVAPLRTVLGSIRSDFREVTYGEVTNVFRSSTGFIAAIYRGDATTTRSLLLPALVSFSEEGVPLDTLLDFVRNPPDTTGLRGALDLVPIPVFASCGADTVVFFDGYSQSIERVSASGGRSTVVRLPASVFPIRPSQLDDRVRYYRAQIAIELEGRRPSIEIDELADRLAREHVARFPPNMPRVTRLACGPNRSVLLQGFSLETSAVGYGAGWYMLDIATETFSRVNLPRGFDPRDVRGDTLVGLVTDDVGRTNIGFAVALPVPR